MPKTICQACVFLAVSVSTGVTRYQAFSGRINLLGTEAQSQSKVFESYTVKNLFVRVTVNTLINAPDTIVRTRKNSANGALNVSIASGATGTFEDTVNSDSLVSGDTCGYQIVAGGTMNSLAISVYSVTLEHATAQIALLSATGGTAHSFGTTRYWPVNGNHVPATTESAAQFTIRFSATWRRLRAFIISNSLDGSTTVRTRKNTLNGNQSVTIAAGGTGTFEDAVNTDSLVSGDIINYQIVVGGTSGTITPSIAETHLESTGSDSQANITARVDSAQSIAAGTTRWTGSAGNSNWSATESEAQLKVRGAGFTLKNLFVRVISNTTTGGDTQYRSRKNTLNGNLLVTVAAGATGVFEDTVNSDSVAIADLINIQGQNLGIMNSTGTTVIGVTFEFAGVPAIPNTAIINTLERNTRLGSLVATSFLPIPA